MMDDITGRLILIMAPTGSGKGSLEQHIFDKFPQVSFAVSCTTRAPRPGEKNGVEYHFLSKDDFQRKIKEGEFLEWAAFGGNLYGTLRSEVEERLKKGEFILNEIELQGVEAIKKIIPKENLTIIYIEAGDWEMLKRRALARAPISESELALRYERYQHEILSKPLADYVIDNTEGRLEEAKTEIEDIIETIINNN